MLRTRVIPCLQLLGENLVKTVQFKNPTYVGDFANTVRIFNELEVDELCVLGIRATLENEQPNISLLSTIVDECFMPLAYGGGIRDSKTAQSILATGVEKIIVNSYAYESPIFITELAEQCGVQSVIASIDVGKNMWGRWATYSHSGTRRCDKGPVEWAQEVEELGAGEILLTSINREGTWGGYEVEVIRAVSTAVSVPVVANGGAGHIDDLCDAVHNGNASAVGLGSMVVYQAKGMGVLISFPDKTDLKRIEYI